MVRLLYGLARTPAPYYSSCSYHSTNDQSSPTFRSFQVLVVGVVGGVVVDDGAKVLAAAEVQRKLLGQVDRFVERQSTATTTKTTTTAATTTTKSTARTAAVQQLCMSAALTTIATFTMNSWVSSDHCDYCNHPLQLSGCIWLLTLKLGGTDL